MKRDYVHNVAIDNSDANNTANNIVTSINDSWLKSRHVHEAKGWLAPIITANKDMVAILSLPLRTEKIIVKFITKQGYSVRNQQAVVNFNSSLLYFSRSYQSYHLG